jgi:hypothetical protein
MDFHKSYATMAGCQQNPTHPWFCHVVWVSHPNTMKPTEAKQNGNSFAPGTWPIWPSWGMKTGNRTNARSAGEQGQLLQRTGMEGKLNV